MLGCRWYTATSDCDESKEQGQGQGQHNGDGNNGGTDNNNDNNNGHNNDDDDDDGDKDDVILDMDILHTLYNLANLLQIQGTCRILLPCLSPAQIILS